MTTRISNNSPSIPNAPSISSADPTVPTATTTPATPPKTQPQTTDFWESDDSCPPFVPDNSIPLSQGTPESKAQKFSVKDAVLASPSTPTTMATPSPAKDTVKLEDRRDVQILTKLLEDNDGKIPSRLQACLNGVLYDKHASLSSLTSLLDNKEALRTHLSKVPGSSTKIADKLIENLEKNVRSRIGEAIAAEVRPQIAAARNTVAELNKDPATRREILSTLATTTGDSAVIQSALQEIGIPAKDAKDLAATLAQAHGNPERLAAIATGDSGSKTLGDWNGTLSEFANTEKQLCKLLNKLDSSLQSLHNSVGNGQIKHDRILTNPNFELARNKVLDNLQAVRSPADQVNTLGRIFNEGVANSKKADERETILKSMLIDTASFVFDNLKFGGPASSIVSAMLKAPDIIAAADDVHLANAARLIKTGTEENLIYKDRLSDATLVHAMADSVFPDTLDPDITPEKVIQIQDFITEITDKM